MRIYITRMFPSQYTAFVSAHDMNQLVCVYAALHKLNLLYCLEYFQASVG
jgi:hypothetical protein